MTNQEIENITLESLRDWFKKEKWVRITTSGNIAGPCGTSKNKKNPDRCLPRAKAQSLTKAQRAATARKKKRAGAKGKTVVKNTKAATVKKEGYYENTALEQEIKQYGYENFEDFFNDNPGAEEAVFDFIDQNLARIQKEINETKGLGKRALDEFSSTLASQILNFFEKHEVLRKEPYQTKYKSGLSDEDYVANTKKLFLGAIINAIKKKVMADKTITKENLDKVSGGIPFKIINRQAVISEPLDDATKERIIRRAEKHGYSAKPNMGGGVTIFKETANPQDGKAAPFGSGYKPTKKMKNEKTIKEAMTKDRLLAMMKGKDDVMVRLYDGTYYIVYSPYSDNDDNASMWGDDSVIGINRDGDEREFRYDDIDDVNIYEEKEKMEIKRPSKQGIKRKLRKAFLEELVWEVLTEKDDRCTRIAKRKFDTWPSAYASASVVRCRKGKIWKKLK